MSFTKVSNKNSIYKQCEPRLGSTLFAISLSRNNCIKHETWAKEVWNNVFAIFVYLRYVIFPKYLLLPFDLDLHSQPFDLDLHSQPAF